MSAWPGTLPQIPLANGYGFTFPSNVLESKMDTGPSIRRLRATVAPYIITIKMLMTMAQFGYFKTFFVTTTNYGVDSFTFTDPVLGSISVHFSPGKPPTAVPYSADWMVTITLEVDP